MIEGHAMRMPQQGDWVRWLSDDVGREGQVIRASGPSLTIKWLGVDEPQVFPAGIMYFQGEVSFGRSMSIIERPAVADRIEQEEASGVLGIAAAAARLKTTPKNVRARLRAGTLQGRQRDGRWVEVIF